MHPWQFVAIALVASVVAYVVWFARKTRQPKE